MADARRPDRDDEFYVGYLPQAPPGIATNMRATVALLMLIGFMLAAQLVSAQRDFDASRFEFGNVRELRGVVLERPYPLLLVPRPGDTRGVTAVSMIPLVGPGKTGAEAQVVGLDGTPVRVRGSLVYRDGETMLKLEPGRPEPLAGEEAAAVAATRPARVELGERAVAGEIVDSQCWMGVMKPGATKPHRACAARCIHGGAAPILLVRTPDGPPAYYWLVGRDGSALNRELLDVVAEPVVVSGLLVRTGDMLWLETERDSVRGPFPR